MNTPSIGRIVHANRYDNGAIVDVKPAIITHVWSATCVNLDVFGCGTILNPVTSSCLDEGQAINGWYWVWPARA